MYNKAVFIQYKERTDWSFSQIFLSIVGGILGLSLILINAIIRNNLFNIELPPYSLVVGIFLFLALLFVLNFYQKHYMNEIYIKIDNNKNIVVLERNKSNIDNIITIIEESEIKSFSYKNFTDTIYLDLYERKPFIIPLLYLRQNQNDYAFFFNELLKNYPDKFTCKIGNQVLRANSLLRSYSTSKKIIFAIWILLVIIAILVFIINLI